MFFFPWILLHYHIFSITLLILQQHDVYFLHACSRSQCIINIRWAPEVFDEEVNAKSESALLTIVDLAGAEREKRTGNQVISP